MSPRPHSKTTSKASEEKKVDHYAEAIARTEGKEAAQEKYAQATIPVKYWAKKELGDVWLKSFMDAYNERMRK